jgi:hypothetical protein
MPKLVGNDTSFVILPHMYESLGFSKMAKCGYLVAILDFYGHEAAETLQ